MASTEINRTRAQSLPVAGYFLLAGVSLFWGLNWPGMKIVLGEMTVWWFRAMSVGAGALGLLLIAYFSTGATHPKRAEILPLIICALFGIVGWHLFTGFGVSMMPAGRASIIAFTMPVWAALLSSPILGEAMNSPKPVSFGACSVASGTGPSVLKELFVCRADEGSDLVLIQLVDVPLESLVGIADRFSRPDDHR